MLSRLRATPCVSVSENASLSECTRFGIGGPARFLIDIGAEEALPPVLAELRNAKIAFVLIGGGTNLIVSDAGFDGAIVRYRAARIDCSGATVRVEAGAVLQDLVDFSIDRGLRGLETMTGIPGWVGGAVCGNAGAYGHSIDERIESVRFFDGSQFREIGTAESEFTYRESVFKRRKDWLVTSVTLRLDPADSAELRATATGIRKIRDEKYPPSMRCAGSIFKNLILAQLPDSVRAQVPARVIREGKVPSAYFLESIGAKGMSRGTLRVADYHANLIYNEGSGTSADLRELIAELKSRVSNQFGLELQEEVQYVP